MRVVICTIELFLPDVGSLKAKRQIIKRITERIRSRINASVAETDFQNSWQRAVIGVAMVSSSGRLLDRQVNLIRDIVDDCPEAETVEFLVEYV